MAGDEACGLDRLRRLDPSGREVLRFGEAREFPLAHLLDLPGTAEEEADLEGMAVADGFLWVVGSRGLKRKNAKPDRDHAENAKRLAKVALDGNRRWHACLPIDADAKNEPCLVRQASDGRRALRLKGDSQTNLLTRALANDPHFGPYMAIPGKDNGFDIEGLAVHGRRLLLGLRGPVLRGWSARLEIAVWACGTCTSLAITSTSWPARRCCSTVRSAFSNGRQPDLRWRPSDPIRFEAALTESVSLPHGRGSNRAGALCELPPGLSSGKPSWPVLYDAPGADRKEGEHTAFGDLLRRD